MNKQLMLKFGPVAGLVVSLLTTGVAGYRIFAAPLTHAEEVPALPTPKPESQKEPEEVVETVYDNVYVTPTPRITSSPAVANTANTGTTVSAKVPTLGVTAGVRSNTESHEDSFEDEREDHVEFGEKEEHEPKESPEPTERPEPTQSPEH